MQILILIAEGKSNKEIADALSLAEPTIKWASSMIYKVLGVRNRIEAINYINNYLVTTKVL
jgi:DNA-binding NarL/FixJ family response regulator